MSKSYEDFLQEIRNRKIDQLLSELTEAPLNSDLSKIIALLRDRKVDGVLLPEGHRCGMISVRDILRNTNRNAKPSVLTSYVPVLTSDATIGEAARIMSDYRIRSIPITDGRKIIAQLNSTNLLSQLKAISEAPITSIATADPITIAIKNTATKARELMVRKKIDHLPVKSEKQLAGILTSARLLPYISTGERVGSKSKKPETYSSLDFPVKDIMDINPLTCQPQTTTAEALGLMLDHDETYVLVTQWEEVQGIATHRDFMTLLAKAEPEPEVPVYIVGLPDDPFEAEVTKTKFKRTVNQLHKSMPDIIEARSVIKTKLRVPNKERRRYEVTVHIKTLKDTYSFSDTGWDLPAIYDSVADRFKRLLTQKQERKVHDKENREERIIG